MKFLKSLILMFAGLIFASSVSAVTTHAEWQNLQSIITINQGEQVYFDYAIFSVNPPISYNVKFYDNNYNLIRTYADSTTYEYFVSQRQYITQNDYQNPGTYRVVINARDFLNDVSTSTITLIVNPVSVNHAPILAPIGNKVVNEGELLQFTITATDIDNDLLRFRVENLPQGALLVDNFDNTARFIWQTTFTDSGVYNTKFIVDDNRGGIDFEYVKITVVDIAQNNRPSIIINAPQQNEVISGVYDVRWIATDPDQGAQTLDIKIEYTYNGYEWFVLEDGIDNNDGIFTWDTTQVSDANDYALRITVTDDTNLQNYDQVNFAIDNLFSPNVRIITPKLNEVISGVYDVRWIATDPDQGAQTLDIKVEYREHNAGGGIFTKLLNLFSIVNINEDWIRLEDGIDNNDGIFTWDTTQVSNGEYELRIIATDNDRNIGTAYLSRFIIRNIIQVNQNPIITSNPITIATVNKLYTYDVEAFDPDNDPITYSLDISPEGMIINVDTGLIIWTPNINQIGEQFIRVIVQDNRGGSAQQSFIIKVTTEEIEIEPEQRIVSHIHRITINNVVLDYASGKLNVHPYIRNSGNQDERINVRATIMQNGMQETTAFNLNKNHNEYLTLTLDNINKGFYTVRVEAFNSKNYEVRYAYIKIH